MSLVLNSIVNKCTDAYEIEEAVSYYKGDVHCLDVKVNGKTTTHNIDYIHQSEGCENNEFIELVPEQIYKVRVEGNEITLEIQLVIDTELIKHLYFYDTLYADVIYRDNQFYIENYRFFEE